MSETEFGRHGVLLVNLGTPDTASTRDVRRYLGEFLGDARVLDINPVLRALLVSLIIVPFRGPASAAKYREIWTAAGSPLMVHGTKLRELLQARLGGGYDVALAMRYGLPSLAEALDSVARRRPATLTIIPLFPQVASATVGSVLEVVLRQAARWQTIPPLRLVSGFNTHPGFVRAWIENGKARDPAAFDHVVFSFHGVPHRQLLKADPGGLCCLRSAGCCAALTPANRSCYSAQCYDLARRMASGIGIAPDRYTVCFQSRLGREPWTQPATPEVIRALARAGARRVLVFSPSFVADCLETLHEIAVELAEEFREAGGETLRLVESLNTQPAWIEALADLAMQPVPRHQ
jgi:protoporphyrin/coproporphyrin ferrochelatase